MGNRKKDSPFNIAKRASPIISKFARALGQAKLSSIIIVVAKHVDWSLSISPKALKVSAKVPSLIWVENANQ